MLANEKRAAYTRAWTNARYEWLVSSELTPVLGMRSSACQTMCVANTLNFLDRSEKPSFTLAPGRAKQVFKEWLADSET